MRSNLVEAAVNLAEAETCSRPSLTVLASSARIPMAGVKRRAMRATVWTPEEDAFLKDNLGILSQKEIGHALGRTAAAVKDRWSRDLHLVSPRRNPNWLTLEAFSRGLCIDGHTTKALSDRGILDTRCLPVNIGSRAIRVIDRKVAIEWIADPMHWIYFKLDRVGTFPKQGQRHTASPNVVFWRDARAAIEENQKTWTDAWLTPMEAARLIGLPFDKRKRNCHGINKAINLGILPAVRWGNWRILRSETLRFARARVECGWGKRKIKRIRFKGEHHGNEDG